MTDSEIVAEEFWARKGDVICSCFENDLRGLRSVRFCFLYMALRFVRVQGLTSMCRASRAIR